jgi:ABC-type transport system substrate-binding protein
MVTDPVTGNDMVFKVVDDLTFTLTYDTPAFNLFEAHEVITYQQCMATITNWYCPTQFYKQLHPKYADPAELQARIDAAGVDDWVQLWGQMTTPGKEALPITGEVRPCVAPWCLVEYVPDAFSRYSRNHYFMMFDAEGNQLPYTDEAVAFVSESREIGVFRSMDGENDGSAFQFRLPEMPLYNANMVTGDYSLYHWPSPGGTDAGIYMNMSYNEDPWIGQMLRTVDFRVALSVALDREELNEVLFLGIGTPQNQVPHPSTPYYPGIEFAQLNVEFDPDRANAILDTLMPAKDDEGFRLKPNGERFVLAAVRPPSARALGSLEMIVPMWEDVGIEFTWTQQDDARSLYNAGKVPMFTRGYDMSPYQANPWAIQWSRLAPARSYGIPSVAVNVGDYLSSDGVRGVAPGTVDPSFLPLAPADTWPEDTSGSMMKLRELWIEGRAYPAFHPRRIEIGKEIFAINTQQMYILPIAGFTGNMMGVFLNRNNMLNQAKTHIRDHTGFHLYSYFFEGGMDNMHHPENRSKLYKSFSFLGG